MLFSVLFEHAIQSFEVKTGSSLISLLFFAGFQRYGESFVPRKKSSKDRSRGRLGARLPIHDDWSARRREVLRLSKPGCPLGRSSLRMMLPHTTRTPSQRNWLSLQVSCLLTIHCCNPSRRSSPRPVLRTCSCIQGMSIIFLTAITQ